MMNFCFIASDNFDLEHLNDISAFANNHPDFQSVALHNEDELELLLELMGVSEFSCIELEDAAYCKYWDLSHIKFPEFND